jgi:hypothetical protein
VSEETLDGVAFFIRLRVERSQGTVFVRWVGDDRRNAAFAQTVALVLRRATFVADHFLRSFTDVSRRRADRNLIPRRKDKRMVAGLGRAKKILFSNHISEQKNGHHVSCGFTRKIAGRPIALPAAVSDGWRLSATLAFPKGRTTMKISVWK